MPDLEGSCHCGNIRFRLELPESTEPLPVRCCGCTFCQKHAGAWTSNPAGRLAVIIRDRDRVSRYRFGTKTADFHVCGVCGVVPVVTSEIDGRFFGIVSVNAIDGREALRVAETATDFDGEDEGDRLSRRARNWIPDVTFGEVER